MKRQGMFWAWLSAVSLGGCEPAEVIREVPLHVRVVDENEHPLAGATVHLDETDIGTTDERGTVTVDLAESDGRRVTARVTCPDQWTPCGEPSREVQLRYLTPLDGRSTSAVPVEVDFRCRAIVQPQVLLVRTNGRSGLPVMVLGQAVARTDSQGVAQVVLHEKSDEEIEVVLDTSTHPALRPAMPRRRFTVPRVQQILIFDQEFEEYRPVKKRRRHRHRSGPRRL